MKKMLLIGALLLPLMVLGSYFAVQQPPRIEQGFRTGTFDPPGEAPAFSLDGSNGRKLSLRDQLGKVVILGFGYSNCGEYCPVTLAKMNEVYKKLGSAARDVQLIYVTVDPERDTPERMREFVSSFNPSFLGATGNPAEIDTVEKSYGVVAKRVASRNPALGYAMGHSTSLYVVDRQGRLRALVPYETTADDIVHDLRLVLKMAS